jgi:uncharacterized NAD-dependent epimerase/dehydratase family protein
MQDLTRLVDIIREKAAAILPDVMGEGREPMETAPSPTIDAIILAEGMFGETPAKTANGLVRHSRKYRIRGIIDSTRAGKTSGSVVEGATPGILVFSNLDEAVENMRVGGVSGLTLINGASPPGGRMPPPFRQVFLDALGRGMDVVNTLHEHLGDDPEMVAAAKASGATIHDVRKEPPLDGLHMYTNRVKDLPCFRVAIMGTDSCIGKRTTAVRLWAALNDAGVRTSLVATGQTGVLQGFPGLVLDVIKGDYAVGELEHAIVDTHRREHPTVMLVEGQGAMSHPVYVLCSRSILSALRPHGAVLVHDSSRKVRNYGREDLRLPMPTVEEEMQHYEFHSVEVLGVVGR